MSRKNVAINEKSEIEDSDHKLSNYSRIRNSARALFLQKKSDEMLSSDELQQLWVLLEKSVSVDTQTMDYLDFKRIYSLLENDKMKKYFNASTFAKLQNGCKHGTVSIVNFFNYVMRKVWFQESRIALSLYDSEGHGFLTEEDLENYLSALVPTLTKLGKIDEKFYPFYMCTVVRKFFFFLDSHRTQRIKIVDILESGFLEDLLELRNENLAQTREESNWFSYHNALRLYTYYISLDENQNGMLSKEEFMKFGNGCLSNIFVERIFEEFLTYEGELDYKGFIDIMLMMENKKEPQSLNLYFRILDIFHNSNIDDFVLKVFIKSMEQKLLEQGHDPLNVPDIVIEVFDMIKPKIFSKITVKDLISSGQGDIAVTILTDCCGFWSYENRELLFLDSHEEADV